MAFVHTSSRRRINSTFASVSILKTVSTFFEIWRERRQLRTLDAERLEDLGLTRQEADVEANRPAWDAPERWLR